MSRNEGRFGTADGTPEDEGSSAAAVSGGSELNWAVPTEFVTLPSQGRYYPNNHPLSGKEDIEIRFMTAKEEDILTDRALLKKGVAIDRALQNLIVDKSIRVEGLLLGDKNALVIAARISGYGEDYTTSVICPNCAERSENTFDLSEVEAISIAEALDSEGVTLTENNTFLFTLPTTKAEIECRMLTGKDELAIAKEGMRRERQKESSTALTGQLKRMIVTINKVDAVARIAGFIDNMPARDSRHIRSVLSKVTPNVDLTQSFTCEHCDFTADLEVPLTSDFFWPK